MAVKKSKIKAKPKSKAELKVKKNLAKSKSVRKSISITKKPKAKLIAKSKVAVKAHVEKNKKQDSAKLNIKPIEKISIKPLDTLRAPLPSVVKRNPAPLVERRRPIKSLSALKTARQFTFMKAPLLEYAFEVGDTVEVFCDHEKSRERIRGWIKGIVVQVDNKMVAVQFRSNVFLTDGWMVPDRILWYPLNSEHIRAVLSKKAVVKKEFVIPDY